MSPAVTTRLKVFLTIFAAEVRAPCPLPESQGQNLTETIMYVPYSLDSCLVLSLCRYAEEARSSGS